jgi:hypothetical protein
MFAKKKAWMIGCQLGNGQQYLLFEYHHHRNEDKLSKSIFGSPPI